MITTRKTIWISAILSTLAFSACTCESGGLINVKPLLVPDPDTIDYGQVAVGDLKVRSVKLQNKGGVPLMIKSFAFKDATSDFVFASPVPTAIGASMSLDFNIAFQPQSPGMKTAVVSIDTNDGKGPHLITLTGSGIVADVVATHEGDSCGMADNSMSFGMVAPGMTADRQITIKATGSAPVNILSAVVEPGTDPAFTLDAVMMKKLNPGESLQIKGHFSPATGGPASGAFIITTDAASNPSIKITVCGTGVAPALCAQRLDLGDVAVGDTKMGMMHVTSCGTQPVNMTHVAISSDGQHMSGQGFSITTQPMTPQSLAPMQAIDIPVQFMATALGARKAWIDIASDIPNHPDSWFEIDANGAQPCTLDVQPMTVDFHTVMPGTTSMKTVLVTNSGATACTVTSVQITAGQAVFSLAPAPMTPLTLASGAAATLNIKYAPTQNAMMDMGTITVVGGSMKTVTLVGNPPPPMGCQLEITPAAVNFGVVPPGQTRVAGVTVKNVSSDGSICNVTGGSLGASSSPDFHFMNPGFTFIPPAMPPITNGTAQFAITYIPSSMGSATGTLILNTSDATNPMPQIPLFASSAPPGICVEPQNLPFGPTMGSNTMTFTITACGSRMVQVNSLNWTMADPSFALVSPPALPFMLAPGAHQDVNVQFTSSDMNGHTGVVTVGSDDPGSPAIDVTCTGGPQIVPVSAGRYLYYWQIPTTTLLSVGGDVMRIPLQGVTTATPYWGPRTGKQCTGCHNISPDGRYVAVIEAGVGANFKVIDTQTDFAITLPNNMLTANFMSWNPDVNTNPPYQYAYDDGDDIWIASLFGGTMGKLQGASDPNWSEQMPSWGTDGKIYFARGHGNIGQGMAMNSTWGIQGPGDIMVVDQHGGTAMPIPGASGNNLGNYYPKISPNTKWIAFTFSQMAQSSFSAIDASIKLVKNDGSGTVLPLNNVNVPAGCVPDPSCMNSNDGCSNGCSTSYPNWSLDGTFISFSSNRRGGQGNFDIWLSTIDPATGADGPATNLMQANTPNFEHSAQWSP